MTEVWTDIGGYEGLYRVSTHGRILSSYSNKFLKPLKVVNSKTYDYHAFSVMLYKNKVGRRFYVHVLVCEAFHGPRPTGMQVRHLDSNTSNNHLDNLAWGTPQENSDDIDRRGTRVFGENHGASKLTEEIVRAIRLDYAACCPVKRGYYTRLSERYGVTVRSIINVINRETWSWVNDA